jgi:hypothetical protein
MSFLDNNGLEFLSARITKKGRNSIAKGDFNISYFQVGDSEFDYTSPFTAFTGLSSKPYQKVFSPFDRESGIKYPYKLDSSNDSTTYGVPAENASTETIRNVMGPAGFVSDYKEFDETEATGTTVECVSEQITFADIDGTSSIDVTSGNTYQGCQFITVVFGDFGGTDPEVPVVTGNSNSLIFRITGITGNTLYLDREMPDLSALSGNARVVCNKCENEYEACQTSVDYQGQLNPWTLNVVWTDKPIGGDVSATDESLSGYTSNKHVSTKELLGYTSTGQTFTDYTGGTLDNPTSFVNCFNDVIEVTPEEQRCVAIIHYSELGDLTIDPDRFFKYDDYISYDESTTNTVAIDNEGNDISDVDYFEVYIPFIYYHRNTGTTAGATFMMGNDDFYIKSTKNDNHSLLFRYLLDEQGIKVGKVFPHNKTIVFDDQELVALLDYRSNRRYTLPSPKVVPFVSDDTPENSLCSGSTGQTVWVTYMFKYTGDTQLNGLPCNYFNKISLTGDADTCALISPSQVGIKFCETSLSNMKTTLSNVKSGFVANQFYALLQVVDTGDLPITDAWRLIDLTSYISGHTVGSLINPTNMTGYTFVVTKTMYDAASIFDLESHLKISSSDTNYLGDTTFTTEPQFGDEQPFPGSIKVVRASDVEVMNFLVNLPSSQFLETQNPTYVSGAPKKVTDITLLNNNKDVMVVAKTTVPVTRTGAQVFSIKLDF